LIKTDRRKYPRFETTRLISYICLDSNGNEISQGSGKGINVSLGGILIETHNPINPQDITLIVISIEDELFYIKGKTIYCREEDSGKFRTGIQFLETNEKIISFVKKLDKSK
jgi:hypothetical protein